MGNIIVLLLLVGAVVGGVFWLKRRRDRPEARLRRDFRKLRRSILAEMKRDERKQARELLDACDAHIEGLLKAKEQHQLLRAMSVSARELTGHDGFKATDRAATAFDREVAASLSRFFGDLGRITALVGLRSEDPLLALREFTGDLEEQRAILSELSKELSVGYEREVEQPEPEVEHAK